MLKDVVYGLRVLRRQPIVTLTVVATLAVGIGATTAIFSVVNAVLLRPLPYPHSEDLRSFGTGMTDGRVTTGKTAPAEVARLREQVPSIVRAAVSIKMDAAVEQPGQDAVPVEMYAVSEGFFEIFSQPMTLGRSFTPEEHAGNGLAHVVIGHRLWTTMFGSDPFVIGKTLRLVDGPMTIVGVAPQYFDAPQGADVWIAQRMNAQNTVHRHDGFLRVKPGTTPERLDKEMAVVMAGLARDFPAEEANRLFVARGLLDSIVGDLGPRLLIVLCASAIILLLACVNVTTLLLGRGAARTREMAVRAALGAGRGRIVRQLLTESVLLATFGAIAGIVVAFVGVRVLLLLGASKFPRFDSVPFDSTVLLFALGNLLATGLLIGFAPALRLALADTGRLMNEEGRSKSGGLYQSRMLTAMIGVEIALAIALVANVGSLVGAFAKLNKTDPGFATNGRVTMDVLVSNASYKTADQVARWVRDVSDRVATVPGVNGVATMSSFPLSTERDTVWYIGVEGQAEDPGHPKTSRVRRVGPRFFETMGIRMSAGREFTWDDRQGTALVGIVNRTFARHYFGDADPLTRRFAVGYPTVNYKNLVTVIGVVDDVKYASLADPSEETFYLSVAQLPFWRQTVVVSSASADPTSLIAPLRAAVREVDARVPVEFGLADRIVAASLNRQRLGTILLALAAATALLLALVGIYGVVAYSTAQRRRESAIRLALGASPSQLLSAMIRRTFVLAAAGVVSGAIIAYAIGRIGASQFKEIGALDPLIVALTIAGVFVATMVTSLVPARRNTSVDPALTLRSE